VVLAGEAPSQGLATVVPAGTLLLEGATPSLALGSLEVPCGELILTGWPPVPVVALNICRTDVLSLNPVRRVVPLSAKRSVESLGPVRRVVRRCPND
jgi:hypothetical protein